MILRPFRAIRPNENDAALVASVPYDVCDAAEARALALGNPKSFLHVSRPEVRVHTLRNIESYLLSDEILRKYCEKIGKGDVVQDCIALRDASLASSVQRGNPSDDLKSASGTFYVELKKKLRLTQCGATAHAFMLNNFAPLVTPETEIYQILKEEIFGAI